MRHDREHAVDLEALLRRTRTIAVVGCSRNPNKAAHAIPRTLQACGFRVIPVNPAADEILGERAYPRLEDVPEAIDLVDVFRPPAHAAEIARAAVDVGAKAVWLQVGITSPEARRLAEEAGLDYVEDRCLGVDVQVLGVRGR
jgi:uncharacterized protein